jgi:hypothetical protein
MVGIFYTAGNGPSGEPVVERARVDALQFSGQGHHGERVRSLA